MEPGAAICVLGMHRSGTSCLTGLLENAGVYLGDVSKKNPHNLKGNQENLRIMRLHDDVLAGNGARWDDPPAGPVTWSEAQQAALRSIVDDYRHHARWAFKDPRSLFTLSAWRDAVPGLRHIGTFRHPGAVAQSLYRRGRMLPDKAYRLWLLYNEKLLEYHARSGFDILCFDLDPAGYLRSIATAFRRLGLDASDTALTFFEDRLRSAEIDPAFADPPAEVLAVYAELRRIAS
jgi:hypothetical protein